jgi:hypothetical protein
MHAGVRDSAFAVLLTLTQQMSRISALSSALVATPALWGVLKSGVMHGDALVRKRARQSLADLVTAHTTAPNAGTDVDAAWAATSVAWGHWFALYDSLSSYALKLLQASWHVHLPQLLLLLASSRCASSCRRELPNRVDLEHVDGADSSLLPCGVARSWVCVLFEQALSHANPLVVRFVALRFFAACAAQEGEAGLRAPLTWVSTVVSTALSHPTLTSSSLELISQVRLLLGAI